MTNIAQRNLVCSVKVFYFTKLIRRVMVLQVGLSIVMYIPNPFIFYLYNDTVKRFACPVISVTPCKLKAPLIRRDEDLFLFQRYGVCVMCTFVLFACRYFLRATISRRLSDITKEMDIAVHTLCTYPELNSSIKMEVGIEDCLHIEFEYNKSKYEPRFPFQLSLFLRI